MGVAAMLGVLIATSTALAGGATTTSTTTSTTTTTVFGGCAAGPTFESILCRLDALVAYVEGAADLGRLQANIGNSARKARKQCGKAADATRRKVASNQLKKCAKSLDTFRHKLDSNNAKKIVPEPTRAYLRGDVAAPLRSDVNALRGSL
jgi:hypothetical protein